MLKMRPRSIVEDRKAGFEIFRIQVGPTDHDRSLTLNRAAGHILRHMHVDTL